MGGVAPQRAQYEACRKQRRHPAFKCGTHSRSRSSIGGPISGSNHARLYFARRLCRALREEWNHQNTTVISLWRQVKLVVLLCPVGISALGMKTSKLDGGRDSGLPKTGRSHAKCQAYPRTEMPRPRNDDDVFVHFTKNTEAQPGKKPLIDVRSPGEFKAR